MQMSEPDDKQLRARGDLDHIAVYRGIKRQNLSFDTDGNRALCVIGNAIIAMHIECRVTVQRHDGDETTMSSPRFMHSPLLLRCLGCPAVRQWFPPKAPTE